SRRLGFQAGVAVGTRLPGSKPKAFAYGSDADLRRESGLERPPRRRSRADTAGFMPVENNARVTTRRADTDIMTSHRIFTTRFASVYPLYIAKAEKKGRTRAEVDQIIGWLTGYSQAELA